MDATIPSPTLLTVSGSRLFVVDDALRRVTALEARTGKLLWSAGRQGQGPEEFAGVAAVFADRDGGVAVVDIRNRRIARLDAGGRFSALVPLTTIGQQPNQACPSRDGFLVADVFQPLLLRMDDTGAMLERLDPLWRDLAPLGIESRQVLLRSDQAGRKCLVALVSGRGFGILTDPDQPVMGHYVEAFDPFGVGTRQAETEARYWAAIDAEFDGDAVLILFSGRTSSRNRLLDRYSAASGVYLDTFVLPFETNEIAAGDGLVFAIDSSRTGILALRPRR